MTFSNRFIVTLLIIALLVSVACNAGMAGYLIRDPAKIVEKRCVNWSFLKEDEIQYQILRCKLAAYLSQEQYEILLDPTNSGYIHSYIDSQRRVVEARQNIVALLDNDDFDTESLSAALANLRTIRLEFMESADEEIARNAQYLDSEGLAALADVYRSSNERLWP